MGAKEKLDMVACYLTDGRIRNTDGMSADAIERMCEEQFDERMRGVLEAAADVLKKGFAERDEALVDLLRDARDEYVEATDFCRLLEDAARSGEDVELWGRRYVPGDVRREIRDRASELEAFARYTELRMRHPEVAHALLALVEQVCVACGDPGRYWDVILGHIDEITSESMSDDELEEMSF